MHIAAFGDASVPKALLAITINKRHTEQPVLAQHSANPVSCNAWIKLTQRSGRNSLISVAMLLTSEPAAAQSIRLLLGLAIQKVEVALRAREGGRKRERKRGRQSVRAQGRTYTLVFTCTLVITGTAAQTAARGGSQRNLVGGFAVVRLGCARTGLIAVPD